MARHVPVRAGRGYESKPRLVANLGDTSPFEYGGYFIYFDPRYKSWQGVYWDRYSEEDENEIIEVYGFDIPDDVLKEYDWVDWKKVMDYSGAPNVEDLDQSKLLVRADMVRAIGEYGGFIELDNYPERRTGIAELEAVYGPDLEALEQRNVRAGYGHRQIDEDFLRRMRQL